VNERLRRRLAALEASQAKGVILPAEGEPGALRVTACGRTLEQAARETPAEFFARVRRFATSGRRYAYAVVALPVDCQL
jgi:hypothetical protein